MPQFLTSNMFPFSTKITSPNTESNLKEYNQQVDYVICGHVHHFKAEEVGKNSEVIACRSIMGGDPYGASLNRVSNAGASLFVFENGKGKTCEYTIKLD